jgi:FkbM family methyltransferase
MELAYYSQSHQDEFLDKEIFKRKEHGFFVDIGAHDGVTFNNTYFFEKNRKWNGICVEPIPEVFDKLNKNRHCKNIAGCISSHNGKASFLRLKGYTEMLSGLVNDYDPRHVERIERELQQYGGEAQEIIVECFNINYLLKENNVYHVDYCSIDVEGPELDILKSIDFSSFKYDVFTVENNYGTSDIRDFLHSKGYDLIARLGCDEVYHSELAGKNCTET